VLSHSGDSEPTHLNVEDVSHEGLRKSTIVKPQRPPPPDSHRTHVPQMQRSASPSEEKEEGRPVRSLARLAFFY
jgi:hypothetical protein